MLSLLSLSCATALVASPSDLEGAVVQTCRDAVYVAEVTAAKGVEATAAQLTIVREAIRRELAGSGALDVADSPGEAVLELTVELTRLETTRTPCPGERSTRAAALCRQSWNQTGSMMAARILLAPGPAGDARTASSIGLPTLQGKGFVVTEPEGESASVASDDARGKEATTLAALDLAKALSGALASVPELQPKVPVRELQDRRLALGSVPAIWEPGRVLAVYAGAVHGPKRLVGYAELRDGPGGAYARVLQLEDTPGPYFVGPAEGPWRFSLALGTEVSNRMSYQDAPRAGSPWRPGFSVEVDYRARESVLLPLFINAAFDVLFLGDVSDGELKLFHFTAGLKGRHGLGRAAVWMAARGGLAYYRTAYPSHETLLGYGGEVVAGVDYAIWSRAAMFASAGLRVFTSPIPTRNWVGPEGVVGATEPAHIEFAPMFCLGVTVTP